MNPKVTIIVPVYNTEKYLRACIDSLIKIDFKPYEVIFIDNRSSDGSYKILKKIKKKNFKIYRNKKNFGQSYSLNKAINLSKSQYIAIMDSDDICLPNRIKESYKFLNKNKKYSLVAGCSDTIDEKGKILLKRRFTLDFELIKLRILIENPISHTTVMYRKSVLNKIGYYSEKLNYTQDYDLFSKIILKGYKVKILNKKFTLVRKHKKQQSYKFRKKQLKERLEIAFRNFSQISKINKDTKLLIKFIIYNYSQKFDKIKLEKKKKIFENFLDKNFNRNLDRLYFCSLIFSRKNKFAIAFKLNFLMKYLVRSRIIEIKKETFLRLIVSLFKIFF